MRSLIIVAFLGVMTVESSPQDIRDGAALNRRDWAATQKALRELYPPLHRSAGIDVVSAVVAYVDSTGVVSHPALESPSGFAAFDEAALEGVMAFRFQPPIRPGLYRISVPFVVDSLRPPSFGDECFPVGALVALIRSTASGAVLGKGGPNPSEWNTRTTDDDRDPNRLIYHRLYVTASSAVEERCGEVLKAWIPSELDSVSSGRPGFSVCAYAPCEESPEPEREYTIEIEGYRVTWENEWTFEMKGSNGSWVVRCPARPGSRCFVAESPPTPIT